MNVSEIREKFLRYFESKGHTIVASSPLVPANDPTLLFTNSGMVQFKDVFLGREQRPYKRATSSQRSVRAGGKHNDLENVGYTARHHTFFEMLGNFSFGDYFKRDAIHYAWELLTKVYQLPAERLWVTVYQDDDEAFEIWANEVGVPVDRIIRIGDNKGARYASDNFWQMADTGPCGPCSEIFYDHGPEVWGGPPGSPEQDGDRYIEVWNLVFMQFERDESGTLTPLPKPCVDTGMGLERIAAVLQHVHSNYEIDLFQNLIKGVARETGCKELANPSLRVIADHIRACSFLVVDGVIPGNEGRGYVLRRIVRRALRHGNKLGQTQPFFYKCVADLVKQMGEAYPELVRESARVAAALKQEEERFGETLEKGMGILNAALTVLAKGSKLDGQTAFTLYDTFGFPLDLTADVCRERGVEIDEAGFEVAMTRQREQARAAGKFKAVETLEYSGEPTTFVGYETLSQSAKITALYRDGLAVQSVQTGDHAVVVLSKTPFYAESGGQVGDAGGLSTSHATFVVEDTQKISADVFGHHGVVLSGELKVGEEIKASVDLVRRAHTVRNHSATHLLHKALREVLGTHVQQKGSLVDAEKTRFDFSHNQAVSDDEIRRIEEIVNAEILSNQATRAQVMAFDDAIAHGAMALFGEKYGDQVRVLDIGSSCELCGGTHVSRTGDIGLFKITSESGVAAGIRRIEAVTGENALSLLQSLEERMAQAATLIKAPPTELPARLAQIMDNVRAMEKEITRLKSKLAASAGDDLVGQAIDVGGVKVLAVQIDGADVASMRETLDKLKGALKSAAIVLAAVDSGKVTLIAGVTVDLIKTLKRGAVGQIVLNQTPFYAESGGPTWRRPEAPTPPIFRRPWRALRPLWRRGVNSDS